MAGIDFATLRRLDLCRRLNLEIPWLPARRFSARSPPPY